MPPNWDDCVTDSEELGALRANLLKTEIRLSEAQSENEKMVRQVERMRKEASESAMQSKIFEDALMKMREDRDVCMQNLQEARKNFALFQSDMSSQMNEDFSKRTIELEALLAARKEELIIVTEHKQKAENQLDRLCMEHRESKVELEKLLEEATKTEATLAGAERARKSLEKERSVLKEKLEKLEEELEEVKLSNMNSENLSRRLENAEKIMIERNDRISDLDADNRTLKQQLELEARKTNRLREDLISEKSKYGDLVARLRSVCAAIKSQGPRAVADEAREHLTDLEDDVKLVEVIDDVIMGALNAARREADALRIQQQTQIQELNDLRRDIVNLRREDNEALNESGDRVRELSMENKNVKEQVAILQERLRKLQVEEQAKGADLAAAKREINELLQEIANSTKYTDELARTQVTLGNLQHETELMRQDNEEIQKSLEVTIRELEETKKNLIVEKELREALLVDHDRLENIHHVLTSDYDRAKFENSKLKEALREMKSASSKSSFWEKDRQRLEEMLRAERDRFQDDMDRIQADSARVKRDNHDLRAELDSIHNSYQSMQDELRKLRLMEVSLKSTIANKDNVIEELRRTIAKKDAEIQALHQQLEMQRKAANEESQKYLRQIEMLLMQNQDLMNRTLTDKDSHHAAQKELQEKLVSVQRHKEKLEEKIMDQYKAMDSRRIQKEKPTLVKRAARALLPKSPARKSIRDGVNGSTTEDSSGYSADEATTTSISNHVSRRDNDLHLVPTCSSSDVDRTSPELDGPIGDLPVHFKTHSLSSEGSGSIYASVSALRQRNGVFGGSMRIPPRRQPIINTIDEDLLSLGSTRSTSALSRSGRPPPPAYPTSQKPPKPPQSLSRAAPPPYPGVNGLSSRCETPSMPSDFSPQDTSTPKADRGYSRAMKIAAEGERRDFVREKDERNEKAMSLYENVENGSANPISPNSTLNSGGENASHNGSTVWYEYGCV
ncbi:hypothetical protein QR680_007242 [Steinernema hermaphroditum]|uniref:Uncharacterized protein n=1 Tax=Steinernema hermaphroditum TaxID=289476 RepID=A0AA39HY39_9BILA|nr:hypothetical protein QR680_007242 [Steinernema hermaphroditum]